MAKIRNSIRHQQLPTNCQLSDLQVITNMKRLHGWLRAIPLPLTVPEMNVGPYTLSSRHIELALMCLSAFDEVVSLVGFTSRNCCCCCLPTRTKLLHHFSMDTKSSRVLYSTDVGSIHLVICQLFQTPVDFGAPHARPDVIRPS